MKSKIAIATVLTSVLGLSGCVGGTTYGTGVSHEQQTLEGLSNMFSLNSNDNAKKIDYAARPDLVMPADKSALPAPVESEASTSDADWPEEPGERLAKLRGQATAPHERSGLVPVSELTREKEGIGISRNPTTKLTSADDRYDWRKEFINESKADKEVSAKRAQLAYSTGPKRKFLTEPPEEYRTPSTDAAAGDLGVSDAEVERLKKIEEKKALEAKTGRTVYN